MEWIVNNNNVKSICLFVIIIIILKAKYSRDDQVHVGKTIIALYWVKHNKLDKYKTFIDKIIYVQKINFIAFRFEKEKKMKRKTFKHSSRCWTNMIQALLFTALII